MSYATNGAISGGASGAAAGTSILPGWGTAIGGVAGAALGAFGGLGADRAEARRRRLRQLQGDATRQVNRFENQEQAAQTAAMQQLAAQRYASYGTLANALAGPERQAAGDAARMDASSRMDAALGSVNANPVGDRSLVGGTASWGNQVAANHTPLLDARRQMLLTNRAQGGMERFDQNAMDTASNASMDLARRAQEAQQQAAVMAAYRRKLLAQTGVKYADPGPTNGELNQQMLSKMGLAGLQTAGGFGAIARQHQLDGQSSMPYISPEQRQQLSWYPEPYDTGTQMRSM